MKAFVLKGPGQIGYMDKEIPHITEPHGVLLRPILVSPCTSDVHTIWQGSPKRENLTLGHECVARVEAAGAEVYDFKPGDIVAVSAITPDWSQPDAEENNGHAGHNFSGHSIGKSIDGAFQELFYLPYGDKNLAHIPEGLSLEDALMCVDVMQTGFTAAEEAEVSKGQTVVVMGIGAIGLAAILASRLRGASRIFAVGSSPENSRLALSMGSDNCEVRLINYKSCDTMLPEGMHPLSNSTGSSVVNEVLKNTGGRGADAVLVCGGGELAIAQAVDMLKYGGGIVSNIMYLGADKELQDLQEKHESLHYLSGDGSTLTESHAAIDGIMIPKFSIGRGMAGKTLKFSLSKGGRKNLERVMREVLSSGIHPGMLISRSYSGLDKIERSIYDMRDHKAIKISVRLGEMSEKDH